MIRTLKRARIQILLLGRRALDEFGPVSVRLPSCFRVAMLLPWPTAMRRGSQLPRAQPTRIDAAVMGEPVGGSNPEACGAAKVRRPKGAHQGAGITFGGTCKTVDSPRGRRR